MGEKSLDIENHGSAHKRALERWRDAYAAYIDSAPVYPNHLYQEVLKLTPQAHQALEAAHYHVAAPNDRGEVENGLSSALPLIVEREVILDRTHSTGGHVEIHMIAGDREGAPRSGLDMLLQTVEYAIDVLDDSASE